MTNDVETHVIKQLTTSNVIDEYQKEAILWNLELNALEEEKELGWLRAFVCPSYSAYRQVLVLLVLSTNVKLYTHFAAWPISPKSGAVRRLHLRLYRFKSSRDTL